MSENSFHLVFSVITNLLPNTFLIEEMSSETSGEG